MNYYKNIIRNVRKIVKCGICGHRVRIEFHHIKPTKLNGMNRGSADRAYDIIKHPDCYIPLCYFCHKKVTSDEYHIQYDDDGIYHNTDSDYEWIWRMIHVI